MAHAQKPDFVFRRNERVHLNRQGHQFSRLLAVQVYASAVVMLDTPCSEVVWRVLATRSIRQFPLHFPSRASPCTITFQLDSTTPHTDHSRSECLVFIPPNILQYSLDSQPMQVAYPLRSVPKCSFPDCINSLSLQAWDFSKLENVQTASGAHSAS